MKNSNASDSGFSPARRPALREDLVEIDKSILRLLLKRHNLLEKMKKNGRLNVTDEKFVREAWQNEVSRISRDPDLSGRFFALLQNISFLPKNAGGENVPGKQRREAFNLAPPQFPIHASLKAPLDSRLTRIWLYLGAAAGQKTTVAPTLQNSAVVDFTRNLMQAGALISRLHETVPGREYEVISTRPGEPLGCPDMVIHTGSSSFNFFLFLAHYLGKYSRVKFSGDTSLKLADFTSLSRALPGLGARMTHLIPKTPGLPVKVECSGVLPPGFDFSQELPDGFGLALLLAAPFYSSPFAIGFSSHPAKNRILAQGLPILERIGAVFSVNGDTVSLEPGAVTIPEVPEIPMDASLASCLLSFPAPLGGIVNLEGAWPKNETADNLWGLLAGTGMRCKQDKAEVSVESGKNTNSFIAPQKVADNHPEAKPGQLIPLMAALCACASLKGREVHLQDNLSELIEIGDFLRACGLGIKDSGIISRLENSGGNPVWNAPTPEWAMALALAACARPSANGFRLGNPGIMTELWPGFWHFYNSLPKPGARQTPGSQDQEKKRRRFLTNIIATPPEIKEEDWDR